MEEYGIREVFGAYYLIDIVSVDNCSSIYVGKHVQYKCVIIKIFRARFTESEAALFIQNAGVLTRLRHPHLPHVVEVGVTDGHPFVAMEYTPRVTLRQRYPAQSRATLEDVLPYVRQIAQALDYLHAHSLVYAELTPENVWLSPAGRVLLGDVGTASLVQRMQHASAGTLDGTVGYLAPEQINGQVCPASDQYALAIMLYEWLCGACPFSGTILEVASKHLLQPVPSLREQVPTIPSAVEQVVLSALEKDPQGRFPSVCSFADALERAYRFVPPPVLEMGISQVVPLGAEQAVSATPLPEAEQPNASPTSSFPPPPDQGLAFSTPIAPPPPAFFRPPTPGMSTQSSQRGFIAGILVIILVIILGGVVAKINTARSQMGGVTAGTNAAGSWASPTASVSSGTPASVPSVPLSQLLVVYTFGNLYAVNANSGAILWSFQETAFAPPVVANGQVYVLLANSATSSSPEVVDVDEVSGKQRWSYAVGSSFGRLGVAGDIVVAAVWNQDILGLNAQTGAKRWQMTIDDMVSPGLLTVSGETVLVSTSLGVEDAVDATNGHILWHVNQGDSEAAAVPGTVYIPTSCGATGTNSANFCLGAYDSISGAQRWLSPAGRLDCATHTFCNTTIPLDNETCVGGNVVYQIYDTMLNNFNGVISQEQGLDAFNASTGRLLWQYALPAPTSTAGKSAPSVPNNTLLGSSSRAFYLEDTAGTLMALSASNHALLWKYNSPNGKATQFVESDGVLALVYTSMVVALNPQTGSQLWSKSLG
jgi:serine/threonine protein kinase/outer membrane protein assembly factor BamB